MNLRTTSVDGRVVDIITEKDFVDKWRMYADNPSLCASSAIEMKDSSGVDYVLPMRNKSDDRPGIYPDGSIYFVKFPDESDSSDYRSDEREIIDFNNISSVEDFLSKNSQIRNMEANVLNDVEVVYEPTYNQNDTPEMKAFKDAIASKQIDINKYAPRFGDNFLNDKRILKTSSITLNKLVNMCKNFDIEAELILRNSGNGVANPMPEEISVVLTGGGDE